MIVGRYLTLVILTFFLLSFQGLKGQHSSVFSQYMFNGLVLNPAYTGAEDALTIAGSFRKQWLGFKGSPMNQSLSIHSPLKDSRSNIGGFLFHDTYGVTSITSAFFSYAFRIDMGKSHRISMGLQGGVSLVQYKYSKLDLGDDVPDAVFAEDSPLLPIPRVGFGIYYDHKKFFIGASAPQILKYYTPNVQLYDNDSLKFDYWLATAGYKIKLNPEMNLEPSVLIKYIRNSPVQVDANLRLYFKDRFWVGVSYRSFASLGALFQVRINNQLQVGYSYDYGLNKLQSYHFGSHELVLKYNFSYEVNAMSPRRFRE